MAYVITVSNCKGGVGKTTLVANLAAALAHHKTADGRALRVLAIDADQQANLSAGLGVDVENLTYSMYHVLAERTFPLSRILVEREGFWLAPATIAMATLEIELATRTGREFVFKKKLEALLNDFDIVLIDCPPSLGLVVTNALAASHSVIIPVQTQAYALYGIPQLMQLIELVQAELNPDLTIMGVLLTFTNRTKLSNTVSHELTAYFGDTMFVAQIRQNIKIAEAPLAAHSVLAYNPAAAEDYVKLAEEVMVRAGI